MHTNNSNIHNTQCHQQSKNSQQGRGEGNSQQSSKVINKNHRQKTPEDNGIVQQNSKVVKTRYGQIVKKNQTDFHIPKSHVSAWPTCQLQYCKSYG